MPNGLTPFDSERGRAAAHKSAEARRAKKLAERASAALLASELATLRGVFVRDDVPGTCWAAVLSMVGRVERGEQVVRDPDAWIRALADVARAAGGEPDSTSLVAHLTGDVLADRVRELQARVGREALPAAVLAADADGS
jgi:hypothetical protein